MTRFDRKIIRLYCEHKKYLDVTKYLFSDFEWHEMPEVKKRFKIKPRDPLWQKWTTTAGTKYGVGYIEKKKEADNTWYIRAVPARELEFKHVIEMVKRQ